MQYIKQDITEVEGPAIIAHGVNCQNVMGSGVAKAIYTKWPVVKDRYHARSHQLLGDTQVVMTWNRGIAVINCWTQLTYGKVGVHASLHAVDHCMRICCEWALAREFRAIHVPKIGCGLGGLDWRTGTESVLHSIESLRPIEFIVHDLEEKK